MIVSELGYFALVAALMLAILQVVLPFIGVVKRIVAWQQLAPSIAYAGMVAMLASFLGLMAAFYYNDFSLTYVAAQSNSLMPWYYKLSATWGGHEGSLLLWITIMAIWMALVARFSRSLPLVMRARVLVILGLVQVGLTALTIFTSSPFIRSLPDIPVDGADLNPLLQDPGLIFHPPMLYMGYVGMVVPFAFAMAALWAGRLDAAWTRWSRPWTLAAWGFLTLGIALGSWWAYYELGWGGWWFWDPVENASFMPWLAGTALLHSLAVTEKRGVFKAWTIMLAIFAFALSLLGTFLVRSGVITSVHSFAADPTRGVFILAILVAVIGGGLLMFALRGWRLSVESQYQLRSRETLLVVNNVILLVATIVVLLGTLYPIIADAFKLGQVSVGAPYFNALFVPLTWLLMVFLPIGTISRYKKDSRPLLAPALAVIASSLVLTAIIIYTVTGFATVIWSIAISVWLVLWALTWSGIDIYSKAKNSQGLWVGLKKLRPSYWGMHIAHIGLGVLVLGVAFTSALSVEKDVALGVGESADIANYRISLHKLATVQAENYDATQAHFKVVSLPDNKPVATLLPQKRVYVVRGMPMTEAAIDANFWRDVYVALGEPLNSSSTTVLPNASQQPEQWAVRIYVKPAVRWIWLGAIIMALGALLSLVDKRYRFKSVYKKIA